MHIYDFIRKLKIHIMKALLLSLVTCMFLTINATAQTDNLQKGQPDVDDIRMEYYPLDKSAEAVVLFDKGLSYFVNTDEGFNVCFERTTRIKIFKESGFHWAEFSIPFYREGGIYEKVSEIEAFTYNFEGGNLKKSALDLKDCHDEKINEYWYQKKFAMPAVKEGSIIEYRYKIYSQYLFNLRDWEFQWKIPVVYSQYIVKMVPFFEYSWLLQGASKFDTQKTYVDKGLPSHYGGISYNEMIHEYAMKNVPAFGEEELITSINDYIIKLDFQLAKITYTNGMTREILTTWPNLIKDMLKDDSFGKYLRKSEKKAGEIFNLKVMMNLPDQVKYDTIMNYVKSNFTWNETRSRSAAKTVSEFFEDKRGNNAEINLFAVGLLNALGLESYPLLISTRSNGKIKFDYPYGHFFNYVVITTVVDGKMVLGDGTDIKLANNRLPISCINDKGLLIKDPGKEKESWIDTQCKFPNQTTYFMNMEPKGDHFIVTMNKTSMEYDALNDRNTFNGSDKRYADLLGDTRNQVDENSVQIMNRDDISKPFKINYTITSPIEEANGKIYISPFLNTVLQKNPLTQTARNFPIDLIYPQLKNYVTTIQIPEGYTVDYLPTEYSYSGEIFEFNYKPVLQNNKISISFGYQFKNSVFKPADYMRIKACFVDIVKKGNEKVVLKRIE
jgi:hypothetical protein